MKTSPNPAFYIDEPPSGGVTYKETQDFVLLTGFAGHAA
jgi:hypothetical protein